MRQLPVRCLNRFFCLVCWQHDNDSFAHYHSWIPRLSFGAFLPLGGGPSNDVTDDSRTKRRVIIPAFYDTRQTNSEARPSQRGQRDPAKRAFKSLSPFLNSLCSLDKMPSVADKKSPCRPNRRN